MLLKAFNKQFLSDISHYTRKAIKDVKSDLWSDLEKDAATKTLGLFPEEIHPYIQQNLITPLSDPEEEKKTESKLVSYIQLEVAKLECETNKRGYPDNPYYLDLFTELEGRVDSMPGVDDFRISFTQLKKYREYIKNMKYLRRWNRINRSVETSVMGHTFGVAALALVAACLEVGRSEETLSKNFIYQSILRALFHDVPEAFTGDVISPVKDCIKTKCNWPEIEERRLVPLREATPEKLLNEIDDLKLFSELPSGGEDKVGKLVKDCDRLSLLLECVFERSAGGVHGEMEKAYNDYARTVLCSQWRSIREIALYGLFKKGEK